MGSSGDEQMAVVSSEVWGVLSAAVAEMTGNDSTSSARNTTTCNASSVCSADGDSGPEEEHMGQPSHSKVVAVDSEVRRQKVVDLAKKRVATSAAAGIESSKKSSADSAVPTTVICTEGGEDDKDSSSGLGLDDDKAQEERETLASLSPLSGRVERSMDEIKAKMMMAQEDSDDEEEMGETKEGSEVRISITSNTTPDAMSTNVTSSKKLQQSKEKAEPMYSPRRLTIDVPFDERPRDLPDDVPSFDAGEDWEGSIRRPASPPVPLPPVPPPAPTNATSKGKHFFCGRKDKKKAESAPQPPRPPSPDNDNGANEVPNAQSTSYEDSDFDVDDETPFLSKLAPSKGKDVNEDVMVSVARARAAGLATNDEGINERQKKRRSSNAATSSGSSNSSRRRVRGSSRTKSLRRKGRTHISKEDRDEEQQEKSRRHRSSRSSRKSRSERLKRPESTALSDGDQTKSTISFVGTTSNHGIGGSKGILEACDPMTMDSSSPKSSIILEFEDQDLIGWIMNGDACTSLQKCGTDSDNVHSHRVEQVTSEDDDMSDISNLTGKWRRSRLLVEEQQRRKAIEEAKKRHHSSPFDFMSMLCGDLKALFCDGLKADAASF